MATVQGIGRDGGYLPCLERGWDATAPFAPTSIRHGTAFFVHCVAGWVDRLRTWPGHVARVSHYHNIVANGANPVYGLSYIFRYDYTGETSAGSSLASGARRAGRHLYGWTLYYAPEVYDVCRRTGNYVSILWNIYIFLTSLCVSKHWTRRHPAWWSREWFIAMHVIYFQFRIIYS